MIDRISRSPLAFAGAFLVASLLGAGIVLAVQALQPGGVRRAEMEGVVRSYLLDHPEILPEAMERLRAREAEKDAQAQQAAQKAVPADRAALEKPFGSAWAGNPKGDVTVVAFMDYACGYCRRSLPAIAELVRRDPNVRIVYREYPVLGPESVIAAHWALAAAQQGKFLAFHDALFASDGPSNANIEAAAKAAGLDMAAARQAIQSAPVSQEIAGNHKIGARLAMSGTPSWVVGGKLVYGMRDYAGLAEAVAAAR
jgi:protein-disulfide isomerase